MPFPSMCVFNDQSPFSPLEGTQDICFLHTPLPKSQKAHRLDMGVNIFGLGLIIQLVPSLKDSEF